MRVAEWRYQCDEWRKHCARKRAHLYNCVSLDQIIDDKAEQAQTLKDLIAAPQCVDIGARMDIQYLFWYLEYHGFDRELTITRMVLEKYPRRQIARNLGIDWWTFRRHTFPRWQGLCQSILDS